MLNYYYYYFNNNISISFRSLDIIGHHHAENLVLVLHQDQEDGEVDHDQGIYIPPIVLF